MKIIATAGRLVRVPGRGLVAAGLALLIAGCASSTASPTATSAGPTSTPTSAPTATATPTTAPTPPPTPTPAPTAAPSPIAGAWKAVPDSSTLKKIQFYTVAWTGSRFAAGGVATDGSAVFLDSPDGITWHLQATVWKNATIRKVASGPLGLVAVGDRLGRMVSWKSSDGLSWSLTPDTTSKHPGSGKTLKGWDVTPVGGGWMAVGEEDPICMTACAPTRALVWTSPDGSTWTQAPAAPALASAAIQGVIQSGARYVAVGKAGLHGAVWTSTNGTVWTRIPDTTAFHAPAGTDPMMGEGMQGIAGRGGRLVAVGQVYTQGDIGSALGWSSADAKTWKSAKGDKFLFGQMFAVEAVPTGYLAVGPSGPDSCLGGIWSSVDGASWKCEASAAGFARFAPYDTASSPTREVVVGFGRPGGATTGAVWTRALTAP